MPEHSPPLSLHLFHEAGVDCGVGYCHDSGDGYHHPLFTGPLDSHECAGASLELAAGNPHLLAPGKIYIRGLKEDELLVVAAHSGYELLHLDLRNRYLLMAAAVGHVLQVVCTRFHPLDYRLPAVNEYKVARNRRIPSYLSVADYLLFPLHGYEALQASLFQKCSGLLHAAVGGSHGIPQLLFAAEYTFGALNML